MAANRPLIAGVRKGLAALADPVRAEYQKAYMKSAMPYYGVNNGDMRRTARRVFAEHPLPDFGAWRDTALELWRRARHREERYAALELLGYRAYREHQVLAALPMYEEMVVTGGWWDYVDDIAVHRLGPMLLTFPREMGREMRAWSRDPDMWKRRASIICQVLARGRTDTGLLRAAIEPNLGDRDFFVRKAIGWALREHAKVDAAWVAAYVDGHQAELSGLSRREALKHISRHSTAGNV
ncbi:MAG TPA: DNA alkylation repair protein [Candidatus Dormibacteraeota bacterium]|jgi:3-methyladenine DNA glycosylase AlkD|nr:DNA alkylation repair protein [Candidatus Dormibacteraeota bacterium]